MSFLILEYEGGVPLLLKTCFTITCFEPVINPCSIHVTHRELLFFAKSVHSTNHVKLSFNSYYLIFGVKCCRVVVIAILYHLSLTVELKLKS